MMAILRQKPVIWLFGVMLAAGCSDNKADLSKERLAEMAGGELKDVVPVSGTVFVDGEPTAGVNLYLYKQDGAASHLNCRTGDDGTYCWSTHLQCDGLEPGAYRLGFEYIPKPKKNDKGEDLFKGKYKNPMKNDFKLEVEAESPQTDVNYELKLKS